MKNILLYIFISFSHIDLLPFGSYHQFANILYVINITQI